MPRVARSYDLGEAIRGTDFAASEQPMTRRIHPMESALLVVVTAHLVFLPWALGTMHVWSQSIGFGFSVLSLGLALWPRNYRGIAGADPGSRLRMVPSLLRYPIFWLGGIFLLYTLIQGLNPAWEWTQTASGGWLRGLSHLTWLPSGMRTPFTQSSPWRALMIHGAAWMSVCAVWTGFSRRSALRVLLISLAVNGCVLAVLGLGQRALHADRIFWFWKPPAAYFVSSFIYRNHAGAYFNLVLAITCAVAAWYYRRQVRQREPSSPAVLFGLFAAIVTVAILYSYSRAAALLMIGFLLCMIAGIARAALKARRSGQSPLTTAFISVVFLAVVVLSLVSFRTERMVERMRELEDNVHAGREYPRFVVARATWEMIKEQPVLGWGAGSWRFCFPGYQVRYPEIWITPDSHRPQFFEHAHDDYLELLSEYGIVACGLLVAGWCWYCGQLIRLRVWRNAPAAILLMACLVTMAHAALDFPFYNPAILTTWCCLWPIIIRWLEIERGAEQRP